MISLIHIHQLYKLVYANIDYTLRYSKGLSLKSLIGLYHVIVIYIKTTSKCILPQMVTAIYLCLIGCSRIFWSSEEHYSGTSISNFENWRILKIKIKKKKKIFTRQREYHNPWEFEIICYDKIDNGHIAFDSIELR